MLGSKPLPEENMQQQEWPQDSIFTIGHSNMAIERFIGILQAYEIEKLIDVRSIPRSRHNPQFNADSLAGTLPKAHIAYEHMKALGGLRHTHKDSPNMGWRNSSFRGYADYMQTEEFREALSIFIETSRKQRTAIMCAEAVPWRCHRSLIADALLIRSIPVVEILAEDKWRMHSLTSFAHVEGRNITYPPEQEKLL